MKKYLVISDLPNGFDNAAFDKIKENLKEEISMDDVEHFRIPSVVCFENMNFLKIFNKYLFKRIELVGVPNIIIIHFYKSFDVLKVFDKKNPGKQINSIRKKIEKSIREIIELFKNKKNRVIGVTIELGEVFKKTDIADLYEVPIEFNLIE